MFDAVVALTQKDNPVCLISKYRAKNLKKQSLLLQQNHITLWLFIICNADKVLTGYFLMQLKEVREEVRSKSK